MSYVVRSHHMHVHDSLVLLYHSSFIIPIYHTDIPMLLKPNHIVRQGLRISGPRYTLLIVKGKAGEQSRTGKGQNREQRKGQATHSHHT